MYFCIPAIERRQRCINIIDVDTMLIRRIVPTINM